MLVIFLIIWLISPIVLLPLYFSKRSECNRLAGQNWELSEQLKQLRRENAEAPAEPPKPSEVPQNTSAETAPNRVNPYSETIQYDMPTYNIPRNIPPRSQAAETVFADKPQTAFAPQPFVPESPKKGVSTINIILILGALLISLSGFIFAVATWGVLSTFFKSVVLISFSAVFFAIHSLSERKLKLPQTGRVFYILGSIFLPSAVVAAGVLKVFGEYFSFTGDGRAAFLAVLFLTVCVPFFKGAHDYKNRFFAATSFYTFSAAVVSLIWQISPDGSVTALITSVFALAVVIFEPSVQKIFNRLFGEDNVFSTEWNRFSVVNAWALSVVSLFSADSGFVSLAAFALFSVCFLTKTVTDKGGTAGAIAFTFFITTAMFTGFDPREMSDFACVIAATALICGVLSVMGIFPETLKKALNILGIIAACITGLFAFIENAVLFSDNGVPSTKLVIAMAAVFAEMLIFALRYKNSYYKAMSFGAFLLLTSSAVQLICFNLPRFIYSEVHFYATQIPYYSPFFSYLIVFAYFCAARFTKLKEKLYAPANDIILAAYAFWSVLLINDSLRYTSENTVLCLTVLALGTVISAVSNHKKFSPVICPVLTFFTVFPLYDLFEGYSNAGLSDSPAANALGVVTILICVIGGVLLFIKPAKSYSKAYGIAAAAILPIYVIAEFVSSSSDFTPLIAVTVYTALYLLKSAFPREKYGQICLLHGMILLTMLFVGIRYSNPTYLMCCPAAASMLIFAVNMIGTTFGGLEKTSKHTEHFLWYALPAFSGILLWISGEENVLALTVFGVVLGICAVLLSVFRRNTIPLIFPVFAGMFVVETVPAMIVTAVLFAALGRLLFRQRLWEKYYADVFGISSFLYAIMAFNHSEDGNWRWGCLLLLALLAANLMRRGQTSKVNKIILTVSAAFLFPIWWIVPFFTVPELIEVQFNLLPVVIFCVILRFIWRDSLPAVYNFAFVSAIISLVVLFIDAMASGNNFDSIFIGAVLLVMLAVSFVIKKKRWFVLAVASMVVSAVLLSISRLDSIAWLVYLAVAGAVLIALGVMNELKKQRKKDGEDDKLTRFMSDWKW